MEVFIIGKELFVHVGKCHRMAQILEFISILSRTISRGFGPLPKMYHRKNSNQKQSPNNVSPSSMIFME